MTARTNEIPSAPATLEFSDLCVRYGERVVLDSINLQVPHGQRVAVVGPNGAGKSTLFKTLVGLQAIASGSIRIHGVPLGHHLECVAYVPQREEVDWRFPVTVRDVVMMGRYGRLGLMQQPGRKDREAVNQALAQMEIGGIAEQPILELSGGQQQRAFLARAIAQQPHILLMDEPFTGVDIATQESTLRLLDDLSHRDVTMMVSTHDLNLAREHFDQVLLLNHRLVAFGPPEQVLTTEHISAAFRSQVMVLDGALVVDQCCGEDEHTHTAGRVQ